MYTAKIILKSMLLPEITLVFHYLKRQRQRVRSTMAISNVRKNMTAEGVWRGPLSFPSIVQTAMQQNNIATIVAQQRVFPIGLYPTLMACLLTHLKIVWKTRTRMLDPMPMTNLKYVFWGQWLAVCVIVECPALHYLFLMTHMQQVQHGVRMIIGRQNTTIQSKVILPNSRVFIWGQLNPSIDKYNFGKKIIQIQIEQNYFFTLTVMLKIFKPPYQDCNITIKYIKQMGNRCFTEKVNPHTATQQSSVTDANPQRDKAQLLDIGQTSVDIPNINNIPDGHSSSKKKINGGSPTNKLDMIEKENKLMNDKKKVARQIESKIKELSMREQVDEVKIAKLKASLKIEYSMIQQHKQKINFIETH